MIGLDVTDCFVRQMVLIATRKGVATRILQDLITALFELNIGLGRSRYRLIEVAVKETPV